jgi:putative FmdB family regulatory protein
MPIYELKCTACGKVVEVFQTKHNDRLPTRCKACLGKLGKLISRNRFVLKGTGWSEDGYDKRVKAKGRGKGKA